MDSGGIKISSVAYRIRCRLVITPAPMVSNNSNQRMMPGMNDKIVMPRNTHISRVVPNKARKIRLGRERRRI